MENKINCSIKEPHSHLVYGMTFECEKGQDIFKANAFKEIGKRFGNAIRKLSSK